MYNIFDISFEHNVLGSIYNDLYITNDYKELKVIGGFLNLIKREFQIHAY